MVIVIVIVFFKNNSSHYKLSLQRKGTFIFVPHNASIFITNQQGLLKMATSHGMKSCSLSKLSMLNRELILQQEVKLKVAVSIFQVWKNNISFLLLLAFGVRGETLGVLSS